MRFYPQEEPDRSPSVNVEVEMPPALLAALDQMGKAISEVAMQTSRTEAVLLEMLDHMGNAPAPQVQVEPPMVEVRSPDLLLPEQLRVLVDNAVALDDDTIDALRDAIGQMKATAGVTQRVVSAGGSGGQKLPDYTGTWGYTAGTSGTVSLTGGKRILSITASTASGATVTIDGGDGIPIAAGGAWVMEPRVQLVDPQVVFTGTDGYFIDYLTG